METIFKTPFTSLLSSYSHSGTKKLFCDAKYFIKPICERKSRDTQPIVGFFNCYFIFNRYERI